MSRSATYASLGEHWNAASKWPKPATWWSEARCRGFAHHNTELATAWQVTHGDTVELPRGKVKGAELIRLALAYCEICPVQWDCARAALAAKEKWGTFSMPIEDLKRLQKMGDKAVDVIEIARAENMAVQRAVAVVLRRKRT